LKGGKIDLQLLVRGKDADQNAALFKQITTIMKDSGVSHPTS